jgi:hypothetical protein
MISATIAGKEIQFEWTQKTSKMMRVRLSKEGKTLQDLIPGFTNPKKAEYCVCAFLWAILPDSEFAKYDSPESLAMAIDDEKEAVGAWAVVTAIFDEMFPDAEKKTTLTKSPSPESNSDCQSQNGSNATPASA